ncbi:MAG: (Fe-S)-binding protein [Ketobacteraceae bacterium]|nr:(Fe-S)-binding protein [Ketobacteraceae bacterium]
MQTEASPAEPTEVAFFVTCLVNTLRPDAGFAAIRLLEAAGFNVAVPRAQTCCGQPNYNNGDPAHAANGARAVIEAFSPWQQVVVPSASCAGMIRNHYPRLLADDPIWLPRARALAEKTRELAEFLAPVAHRLPSNPDFTGRLTHHHSCSALREIGVTQPVEALLSHCLPNADVRELQEPEACCGFGGTFCVKFHAVSGKMGQNKLADIRSTGAATTTSLDLGCQLHLQSLQTQGDIELIHLAELLVREACP